MSQEIYVACPLCGQKNFTTRGLRQHWCPRKPGLPGSKKHSAPLTKEEWQAAVDAARLQAPAPRTQYVIRRGEGDKRTWLTRNGWSNRLAKASKFESVESATNYLRGRVGTVDEFIG